MSEVHLTGACASFIDVSPTVGVQALDSGLSERGASAGFLDSSPDAGSAVLGSLSLLSADAFGRLVPS